LLPPKTTLARNFLQLVGTLVLFSRFYFPWETTPRPTKGPGTSPFRFQFVPPVFTACCSPLFSEDGLPFLPFPSTTSPSLPFIIIPGTLLLPEYTQSFTRESLLSQPPNKQVLPRPRRGLAPLFLFSTTRANFSSMTHRSYHFALGILPNP